MGIQKTYNLEIQNKGISRKKWKIGGKKKEIYFQELQKRWGFKDLKEMKRHFEINKIHKNKDEVYIQELMKGRY